MTTNDAVNGVDKLTKTVQKNPTGFIILLMGLIIGASVWYVNKINDQHREEQRVCEEQIRTAERDKSDLYIRLLEKNNIIDRYEKVVEVVDSALQKRKP